MRRSTKSVVALCALFGASLPLLPGPAGATAPPAGISLDIDGCDLTQSGTDPSAYNPDAAPPDLVCDDAGYVGGNLGKNWNELDLVPFRVNARAGNNADAFSTYTFAVVVDHEDAGHPGYDVLSGLTLNTAKSSAGCPAASSGAEQIASPGLGGIDASLYRLVTITNQPRGTTCVYDYYARLAVGSHLFPGASLHANLATDTLDTGGVGAQDRSIPVNEILPQELSKDMTAVRDSDHVWNVTKSPSPAEVTFTDTCSADQSQQASVAITVSWELLPATPNGPATIVTNIYATNPAARSIVVTLNDKIFEGTAQSVLIDEVNVGPVTVPANTTNFLLTTHTVETNSTATHVNDVATATYTDLVTGVPVPGQTTATAEADVQSSGTVLNATAVINDVESISGAGFSYSVDGFSGAGGGFDDGYLAGTPTTGDVSWTSDTQSASGSVTFDKTIYVDVGTSSTGSLDDTATLVGFDGFTTDAELSVNLSAGAFVDLTISKTIPFVLDGDDAAITFTFDVTGPGGYANSPTITFSTGDGGTLHPESVTLSGLAPGTYAVAEQDLAPFQHQDPQDVDISLPSCEGDVTFANQFGPATAEVRKVTVPPGNEAGWTFDLKRSGVTIATATTTGAGFLNFGVGLDEGSYTIVEHSQDGYDSDGGSAECSFTVDYPADAGRVFSCTYTNTARGHIIVRKLTNPSGATQSFEFDPSYGANFFLTDTQTNDSGALAPGTYSVAEINIPAGWDLTSATCDDGSSVDNIGLSAGETVTCTFNNRQRGHIIVVKQTDPDGSSQSFEFDPSYAANFLLHDGESNDSGALVPGTYSVAEVNIPTGWDLTGSSCDDGSLVSAIGLSAGETVTCTFNDRQRGHARVVKTVTGSAPTGSQAFTFQLRTGASATQTGTIIESGVANSLNGGIINFTTDLVPGQTYQLCEIIMPGWTSTLGTFVPDSFIPPDGVVPNPNVDNSIVCVNFTVQAGETKEFRVDNTPPPGGRALTIGFWKNWASCSSSSGGQEPVLDEVLASFPIASGQTTHGFYIGNLYVDTCQEAVRLLNKSTVDTNKKMASDPLFNLAAQLVAVELNFQAGAGKCPAVITAEQQAQALLVKYNFLGRANHPKLSKSDATLANNLANTLDRYNNNLLC